MDLANPRHNFSSPQNCLLASLPAEDYTRLAPRMQLVRLHQNEVLYEPDTPISYAYFPEQGFVALLTIMEDGNSVAIAVAGRWGMAGANLALGSRTSHHEAVVQISGAAFRMPANVFIQEFNRGGAFQRIMLDYIRMLLFIISQHSVCNRVHLLQKRLARVLLVIHDQVGPAEFSTTHDFLSRMLGCARSEVAKTANLLRSAGLIDYRRNAIRVINRKGLEGVVCECYWIVLKELGRSRLGPYAISSDRS